MNIRVVIVSSLVATVLFVVFLFLIALVFVPPVVRIKGNPFRVGPEDRADALGRRVRQWFGFAGAVLILVLVLTIGNKDPRPALVGAFVALLVVLPPSVGRAAVGLLIVVVLGAAFWRPFDIYFPAALLSLVTIAGGDLAQDLGRFLRKRAEGAGEGTPQRAEQPA